MNILEKKIDSITESNLENFKKLVRRSIFLTNEEELYFNRIPNDSWKLIFATNFNSNYEFARRVLLNQIDELNRVDISRVDREKNKIENLDLAADMFIDFINKDKPIVFVTDFDNDGSLAQSVINEYKKIDVEATGNMYVEYAQTVGGNTNRGITVDLVEKIINHKGLNKNDEILFVTADNGINSREEQIKIQKAYPNISLLITDHHNPDPEMVIIEDEKTIIFNPKYKPTPFFQEYNISGANTVGVLLKRVVEKRIAPEDMDHNVSAIFETMQRLFQVSNLLDYVYTDPADKPIESHIISKFLKLQPLLNINNSISKIITGEIPTKTIRALENKIENLNVDLIYEEARNIQNQNQIARVLLSIMSKFENFEYGPIDKLNEASFTNHFLKAMADSTLYISDDINPNYIEQLRPYIFSLSADDYKSFYLSDVNDAMIRVFESVRLSEKRMAQELRLGEVVTKTRLPYSVISYADENILTVFNRKFLNKVYNDENPGFSLTLDDIDPKRVSGSFRSLFDISDILKDKKKIEETYNVKIETPGHERAAGFIVTSNNPNKYPITSSVIEGINNFINNSITNLKENDLIKNRDYMLTDLSTIMLIDKINIAIRGNVSNLEKITPIWKLTPDTVWIDKYSTKQYTMESICEEKKYGYITIGVNFNQDAVIVPVELVRRIVENNYEDYLSLGYLDGGVFMAEKVILKEDVNNIIDMRKDNITTLDLIDAFETDFKDKNHVEFTREQIKDNPFFKYNDYGDLDFDLFERMVIGIIDTNNVDYLSVFDVEANGFAAAKLMNFGVMNYEINKSSGLTINYDDFNRRKLETERGEVYILTEDELSELTLVDKKDAMRMPIEKRNMLLIKTKGVTKTYYSYPQINSLSEDKRLKRLPFEQVRNFNEIESPDGGIYVVYNREIKGVMLAYLINDNDLLVPQEMTNLTGITQEVLRDYGRTSSWVDNSMVNFYQGKKILFGAHNTPYDAMITRSNLPKMYNFLKESHIYDSALFSKKEKLAYDQIKLSNFTLLPGVDKSIYFYDNVYSDINLTNFLLDSSDGIYPDRNDKFLLQRVDGQYYLIDKNENQREKIVFSDKLIEDAVEYFQTQIESELQIKNRSALLNISQSLQKDKIFSNQKTLSVPSKVMLYAMNTSPMPNNAIKYSVESMSAQWMIQVLQLSDEGFDIKLVDINNPKYVELADHKNALEFFQKNYHFSTTPEQNLSNFLYYHQFGIDGEYNEEAGLLSGNYILYDFINEFLELNSEIQSKFSESWIYKKVLSIKDPKRNEVTNDLVELVQHQTNIPEYKIRQIFSDAIDYKEKYNIDSVLHHEGHINGPWRGDRKGDVVFEDKLTLGMLAKAMYNPYSRDITEAVNAFNSYLLEARMAFDKDDLLSNQKASDSYTYRQSLLYDRSSKTDMIKGLQKKEKELNKGVKKQIVKFKMGGEVLTPNSGVYAVTKPNIEISREQIELDSKMLSFIVVNEQLKVSLEKANIAIYTNEAIEMMKTILEKNDEQSIDYKQQLSDRYSYVEYNKRDYYLGTSLKTVFSEIESKGLDVELLTVGDVGKKFLNAINNTNLDGNALDIIEKNILKYIEGRKKYNDKDKGNDVSVFVENFKNLIAETKEKRGRSSLEVALAKRTNSFGASDTVLESNFFPKLDINRRYPVSILMKGHEDLRLFNNHVEEVKKRLKNKNRMRI